MEEQTGTITEIVFQNRENGYTVAVVESGEDIMTAAGCLPDMAAGRRLTLRGEWKEHPKYGRQFVFTEYSEEMPDTAEDIRRFLASGALRGVGKKTARLIVAKFGTDAIEIIGNDPKRLTEIAGVGSKKAERIHESWKERNEFAEVSLYFQRLGISVRTAMALYKSLGAAAVDAVKENPYQLVSDVSGIGFPAADRIAMNLGVDMNNAHRVRSGIRYMLGHHVNEGSAYSPMALLLEQAAELLDISGDEVEDNLIAMDSEGEIHKETLESRPVVYLEPYFRAEKSVCEDLLRIGRTEPKLIDADADSLIAVTERETGVKLSENQKYAVKQSLSNGVFVITGGPGTGKTTIINSILRIFDHSGVKTAVAAPTGRAAKRVSETTGHNASTIHRLLEYYYSEDGDAMRFGKTREDPLSFDAVIVDEASMIDILLMESLLSAIPPGARLIVVGDADQLPPVGAGNALRDMLDSELIPSVKLTEIFRQAKESLIIVNAHRINRGEYPSCNEKGGDFFLVRRNGERTVLEALLDLRAHRLPEYYADCDAVRDIQVLSPTRKGPLGCANLNRELQAALNPKKPGMKEKAFGEKLLREGDRVMQVRNNYGLKWKRRDDFSEGEGVFNGDVGYVRAFDHEEGRITVVYEDAKFVEYDFSQAEELELAYAITVHKSQGNEFPVVVMPVFRLPSALATRNLLYTAVTRGKRAVVLVGMERTLNDMVDNNRTKERYSGLCARLKAFLLPAGSGVEKTAAPRDV
ncbi:MAG: ATP-dependent RecD-like DNA helicase [Clostridiales Family XIII bacterium]|jgi:exodeoxyribonuclease V alpha subunit|nr:ATP-dependent RecD-like DNA helicase [Clostridiales Family XIII bacterium]